MYYNSFLHARLSLKMNQGHSINIHNKNEFYYAIDKTEAWRLARQSDHYRLGNSSPATERWDRK